MATHSSTLAWKIPWTEKPAGYSPWGREESQTTEQLRFACCVHRMCLCAYTCLFQRERSEVTCISYAAAAI